MKENNEGNEVNEDNDQNNENNGGNEEEEEEIDLNNQDLLTVRNAGQKASTIKNDDVVNDNEEQINEMDEDVEHNNNANSVNSVNNAKSSIDVKSNNNNSAVNSNLNNPLSSRSKESQLLQQPSHAESQRSVALPSQTVIKPTQVYTYWKNQLAERVSDSFIDQLFPPITESLLDKKIKTAQVEKINIHEVTWKKIVDIYPNASLTVFPEDSKSSHLVINYLENKGYLFEQYTHFYHAVSLLVERFPRIIPQLFKTKNFNLEGYYELYVYTNGEFRIVIVDDYFPIVKGTNSLRFAKPNDGEMWLLLLEKAFAKVHGGYASLLSCNMAQVLQAFTGFPVERINLFDMDVEDTENVIRLNKNDNVISCTPSDKGTTVGLLRHNAYQLVDLFDIRAKDVKLLKLRNLTNASKYSGEWNNSSELWNEDVKVVVNFKSEEQQQMLFMPIEAFYEYFNAVHILTPMFDVNSKSVYITNASNDEDKVKRPQCFNLYLPQSTKVSFSAVITNAELSIETTSYSLDLAHYHRVTPFSLCICKYDPQSQRFANFEGCFRSDGACEMARSLGEGYYVIWSYLNMNSCSTPLPAGYRVRISADAEMNFNFRLQTADYKFNLIKEMVHSGVLQYQGSHMKENEIYTMNDSFYNFSGLALKVVVNPFKDCYQRWMFKPEIDNLTMLFPYEMTKQLEIEVKPKNHWIVLAMRVDGVKPCVFAMKSLFKTFKVNEENKKLLHNLYTTDNAFNFVEFCSSDIKHMS